MKKIFLLLTIIFCVNLTAYQGEKMQIKIVSNENTIVFQLNDSNGAKQLYEQLPLEIEVENFSHNEKIFYPPKNSQLQTRP